MLGLCLIAAGCASRPPEVPGAPHHWSGRLALQIEGAKPQSFSVLFELRGTDRLGELTLMSPLGSTVAQLNWKDGYAELMTDQGARQSDSIERLVEEATGTPLPVTALFEWLKGHAIAVPGWDVDTTGVSDGRLLARRHTPTPAATLRIALTR